MAEEISSVETAKQRKADDETRRRAKSKLVKARIYVMNRTKMKIASEEGWRRQKARRGRRQSRGRKLAAKNHHGEK